MAKEPSQTPNKHHLKKELRKYKPFPSYTCFKLQILSVKILTKSLNCFQN